MTGLAAAGFSARAAAPGSYPAWAAAPGALSARAASPGSFSAATAAPGSSATDGPGSFSPPEAAPRPISARAAAPWRIGVAHDLGALRCDGLGFTGKDVRRSFELAARTLPVTIAYYDNAGDSGRALANADDAIEQKLDLFIEYNAETSANAEIAARLGQAGVRTLAIGYPVGAAPLYAAADRAAGSIAGEALWTFNRENWDGENAAAVIVGDTNAPSDMVADRIAGIAEGLKDTRMEPALDTGGQPLRAESLMAKFLAARPRRKILIAALDDPTALAAKAGIAIAGRLQDCAIVSLGLDRSIHGGASEKKEIDPTNRSSIVLGSVAYYMDRYGYEVLPIAMRMLNGETVPPVTRTRHVLVTAATVFREYPPSDMN